MHSELPALRDLLLRAGGWQKLKQVAALKADAEARRRKAERRWTRRRVLGELPRGAIQLAIVVALGATMANVLGLTTRWHRMYGATAQVRSHPPLTPRMARVMTVCLSPPHSLRRSNGKSKACRPTWRSAHRCEMRLDRTTRRAPILGLAPSMTSPLPSISSPPSAPFIHTRCVKLSTTTTRRAPQPRCASRAR